MVFDTNNLSEINKNERLAISRVINNIYNQFLLTPSGNLLRYIVDRFFKQDKKRTKEASQEDEIIHQLQKWGALKIEDRETIDDMMVYYLQINQPNFDNLRHTFGNKKQTSLTNKYIISVKDREIRINNYIIGRPYATGTSYEFLEYILSQKPGTLIKRSNLPQKLGETSLKKIMESKSFIKIIGGLGFTGEILKAFFYERGIHQLKFRGNEISISQLKKLGINIEQFIKELELAHIRHSPK